MKAFKIAVLCGAVALALAGCKGKSVEQMASAVAGGAVTANGSSKSSESASKVYNSYVKAHNTITGMFYGSVKGKDELLKAYVAQNLGSGKSKGDPRLYLNTSSVKTLSERLEEAQNTKIGGDYAVLEEKAGQLLVTSKELLKVGKDLESYFESKQYLEDKMAKAQATNDTFVQLWTKFNAEYDAMSAEMDKIEEARRAKDIAEFEKAGKLREANNERALLISNNVLKLIDDGRSLKDAQKIAAIDAEIVKLEAALKQLQEETGKTKEDKENYKFESRRERLNRFVGYWRGFKQSKDVRDLNRMIDLYNDAVKS